MSDAKTAVGKVAQRLRDLAIEMDAARRDCLTAAAETRFIKWWGEVDTLARECEAMDASLGAFLGDRSGPHQDHYEKCTACKGTGAIEEWTHPHGPAHVTSRPCLMCYGTGTRTTKAQ